MVHAAGKRRAGRGRPGRPRADRRRGLDLATTPAAAVEVLIGLVAQPRPGARSPPSPPQQKPPPPGTGGRRERGEHARAAEPGRAAGSTPGCSGRQRRSTTAPPAGIEPAATKARDRPTSPRRKPAYRAPPPRARRDTGDAAPGPEKALAADLPSNTQRVGNANRGQPTRAADQATTNCGKPQGSADTAPCCLTPRT